MIRYYKYFLIRIPINSELFERKFMINLPGSRNKSVINNYYPSHQINPSIMQNVVMPHMLKNVMSKVVNIIKKFVGGTSSVINKKRKYPAFSEEDMDAGEYMGSCVGGFIGMDGGIKSGEMMTGGGMKYV